MSNGRGVENSPSPNSKSTKINDYPQRYQTIINQGQSKQSMNIVVSARINRNIEYYNKIKKNKQPIGLNLRKSHGKLAISVPIAKNPNLKQCSNA